MNFVLLQNTNKAALKLASLTGPHKNMFTSRWYLLVFTTKN